jgi:hypothetical protein
MVVVEVPDIGHGPSAVLDLLEVLSEAQQVRVAIDRIGGRKACRRCLGSRGSCAWGDRPGRG